MLKKSEGPAIGIDLGTSYYCVGVWLNNHVEIVVNGQENRTTPSCVAFTDTERLVGEAAENQSISNPTNTIINQACHRLDCFKIINFYVYLESIGLSAGAKRLIGRRFEDPDVQGRICHYPVEVTEGPKGEPTFVVNHKGERKEFNPEEISSMILDGMRKITENYTGRTVKNAVVTVPAYFNNSQRRATRTAGQMAGLNVLRIINEPTAAAVGYGLHNFVDMVERNVLVFDLGGGTFDVSIVNIKGDQMQVKATTGDTCLGGEDFTDRMVSYFMKTFRRTHGKDLSGNPKALRRLRTQCEKAKKVLSFSTETTIDLDYLHEDIDFQAKITRSMFEDLNMDLFLSCIDIVRKCLSDVGMKKRNIHDVVLVGGSTRIPKVEELLKEFFRGTKMSKSINPDEIVAHGATMLAAKLAGEGGKDVKDLVLHDVTPLSLGIEKIGRTMRVLIPKNTPIPTRGECPFTTVRDNQKCIAISVYEGERTMVEQNNFLGRFELDGITPAPAKTKKITISFDVDADGVLTVSAEDRESGVRKEMTITDQKSRLGSIEIERIVGVAAGQKEKDEQEKEKAEAKGKLKNQIYNLKARLRTNNNTGSKMNQASNKKMEEEIARVNAWLESNQEAEALDFNQMRIELESFCKEISKRKSWWSKIMML